MKTTLHISIISILLFTSSATNAADERGQSIMFGDTPGYQTKTPISSINETDETCKRLAAEIERLKGKPQRRYTAKQRFDAECTDRLSNE